MRDAREYADEQLWAALRHGADAKTAQERYDAALRLSTALDMPYRTKAQLMADANDQRHFGPDGEIRTLPEIMRRPLEAVARSVDATAPVVERVIYGEVDRPKLTVMKAVEEYIADMKINGWQNKSPGQRRSAANHRRHAVEVFKMVIGNRPIEEITREDARQYYSHWGERIRNGEIVVDMAKRRMGDMRVLFTWAVERSDTPDAPNPFAGLSFIPPRVKKRRVSYSPEFIRDNFLRGDKLSGLNTEARRALLVIVATGCRPSEIVNLKAENIVLDGPVPHLRLRDRADRELKTATSNRDVPLVGVALAALQANVAAGNRDGFPRYYDNSNSFSAAANKFLKENGLRETPDHTIYCLRHMAEDLAKDAGLDLEMRMELFGHAKTRSEYGRGFTLDAKRDALERALTPLAFDPAVI